MNDIRFEYEDEWIKELFNDLNDIRCSRNLMRKQIGPELTKAVKKRYNEIKAHSCFSKLQQGPGKIESLTGNLKGCYSLRLNANFRLIIKPKSYDLSVESLNNCDTVIIKGVIDYHGTGNRRNWLIP